MIPRAITLPCAAIMLAFGATFAVAQPVPANLSLADAIRLAEAANPALITTQRMEDVALAEVQQARRWPNPELAFEAEEFPAYTVHEGSRLSNTLWVLNLGQEVRLGGKRRYEVQAAESGLMQTQAGIADFKRALLVAVGTAYFTLALAESDYYTIRVVEGQIGEIIALVEASVQQGDVAETELLRLQSEQLELRSDALSAALALDQARVVLLSLLGAANVYQEVAAADSLQVATLYDADGFPIATPEGVPLPVYRLQEMALRQRPDLRVAQFGVAQAEANIALQRAMRIPDLGVSGGYRGNFDENHFDASLSLGLPLWGGLDAGGVTHARAVHRQEVAALQELEALVRSEVAMAASAANRTAERVQLIEQNYLVLVEDLRQRLQISYTLGEAGLLDLIDLQRSYLEALQLRNETVFEFRMSQIELAAAIGITPVYTAP